MFIPLFHLPLYKYFCLTLWMGYIAQEPLTRILLLTWLRSHMRLHIHNLVVPNWNYDLD